MKPSQIARRHRLGQNFLKDRKVLEDIIRTARLEPEDIVLEVGPGRGILTKELALQCKKIIAIELDKKLIEELKEILKPFKNVDLVSGDALEFPPPEEPYRLVANLPYSITSPLLNHFIKDQFMMKNGHPPKDCVVLVQKEVAEKICAKPPRMNLLALNIQTFGEPKIIRSVKRTSFSPVPEVDSALLMIQFFKNPKISCELKRFFEIISHGFRHKRKMLRSAFPENILHSAGIDPSRRAETLTLQEWEKLSQLTIQSI